MSHDHGATAGHSHDHTAGASARALAIALGLTTFVLLAEIVGGLVFNSLALLSDAAHMFTDVAALVIALFAIWIGQKPADDQRTFGYRRLEVVAAAFNACLLFGVAVFVIYEGVRRIAHPETVQTMGMLVVAGFGLVANLLCMRILTAGQEKSLNVRGAYLEVWADMVGSVGVIGGALLMRFTGWAWVDPVVAIAVGLWVLPRTWTLLRETTHVLLEGAPRAFSMVDLRTTILATPGIGGLHDLHVWVSGADTPTCTVHVELQERADGDDVRRRVTARLAKEFDLHKVTIQTERERCSAPSVGH